MISRCQIRVFHKPILLELGKIGFDMKVEATHDDEAASSFVLRDPILGQNFLYSLTESAYVCLKIHVCILIFKMVSYTSV